MRGTTLGEGPRAFPYFFLFSLILALLLGTLLSPTGAQQTEKGQLSTFDRLAEEATLLNKRGQPDKADKKNDSALFFNELGVAYRQKGNFQAAIASYQEALKRDPDNPVIKKNLGDAYFFNKELTQAIGQYQKALESNPRFHQAHFSLGVAYYELGKYQEALEEFEMVLKLNPQNDQAKKLRDTTRLKLKDKQ